MRSIVGEEIVLGGIAILGAIFVIGLLWLANKIQPVLPIPEPTPEPEPLPPVNKWLTFNDNKEEEADLHPISNRIWSMFRLHVYDLGESLRLVDISGEVTSTGWAGQNQCCVFMSEENAVTQGDIWWIRRDCVIPANSPEQEQPWKIGGNISKRPTKVRTGRYLIIAFTNKHHFTNKGKIHVVRD